MLTDLAPYIGFASVSLMVALSPGPSWVYTISTTHSYGRKAGMIGNLGNSTGILCHAAAVAFGLATLLQMSSMTFQALKFIGAGYLLYLGYQAFRQKTSIQLTDERPRQSRRKIFRNGALVSLFNPKISLLMLALLPQFVNPNGINTELQIAIMGSMHALIAGIVHTHIVVFSKLISSRLSSSGPLQRILRWVKGSLFIGFGLRLAFTEQR